VRKNRRRSAALKLMAGVALTLLALAAVMSVALTRA
jgi:hypothetical protein